MSDNKTVTLALHFTPEQMASIRLNGHKPEQTHRQGAPDEVGRVFLYENDLEQMILWVFEPNGDVFTESRKYDFHSGWERNPEEESE